MSNWPLSSPPSYKRQIALSRASGPPPAPSPLKLGAALATFVPSDIVSLLYAFQSTHLASWESSLLLSKPEMYKKIVGGCIRLFVVVFVIIEIENYTNLIDRYPIACKVAFFLALFGFLWLYGMYRDPESELNQDDKDPRHWGLQETFAFRQKAGNIHNAMSRWLSPRSQCEMMLLIWPRRLGNLTDSLFLAVFVLLNHFNSLDLILTNIHNVLTLPPAP